MFYNMRNTYVLRNTKNVNKFFIWGTLIGSLHNNGIDQLVLYICKGNCKSVDHLWFIV